MEHTSILETKREIESIRLTQLNKKKQKTEARNASLEFNLLKLVQTSYMDHMINRAYLLAG